jgi:hypothetical protein
MGVMLLIRRQKIIAWKDDKFMNFLIQNDAK